MKKMKLILGLLLLTALVLTAATALAADPPIAVSTDWTYDGTPHPLFTVIDGAYSGWEVQVVSGSQPLLNWTEITSSDFTYNATNAGTYTVSWRENSSTQFSSTDVEVGQATIQFSWTGITLTSPYSGSAVTAPQAIVTGGFPDDYTVSSAWNPATTVAKDAGSYSTVTTVTLTDDAKEANYTNRFTQRQITDSETYKITSIELTVIWPTTTADTEKEYDGQDWSPTYSSVSPTNIPDPLSDVLEITYTGSQKNVTPTGFTAEAGIKQTAQTNYSITTNLGSFKRTSKEIGITWNWEGTTSNHAVYDGSSHAATATATGVAPGDTLDLSVSYDKTLSADVDTYTATAALPNGTTNYKLPQDNTSTLTITQKDVEVTWTLDQGNWADSIEFDNTVHTLEATTQSFIAQDTVSLNTTVVPPEVKNKDTYTATATLSGAKSGNYKIVSGQEEKTFQITAKPINDNTITIADIADQEYTGYEIAPLPVLTDTAIQSTLVKDTDYSLSYSANTNVGEVTITITGRGNYGGETTKNFKIKPATVTFAWTNLNFTYDGSKHVPTLTINGLKDPDIGTVTATVSYSPDEASKNAGVYTATVTELRSNNYTIDPTTITDSQTYTISPLEAELLWDDQAELVYNGQNQYPSATVGNLIPGDTCDVTVVATDAVHVGPYSALASALSNPNYKLPPQQQCLKTFFINQLIATLAWNDLEFLYDGDMHCATATVSNLVPGDSCEVTVTGEARDAGNHTAEATALINDFNDYALPAVRTQMFTITPKPINANDVTIDTIRDQEYTGFEITPKPIITDDATGVLVEGRDYTLSYSNNINVGTADVTITGMGNYAASPTNSTTFKIDPKPIMKDWAAPIPDQIYTGHELMPEPEIKDPDRNEVLRKGIDYTVTWTDNVEVSDSPRVIVTGIGNYKRDFELTFTIDKKDIGGATVTIDPISDQTYTGSLITPKPVVKDSESGKTLTEGTDYTLTYENNLNVGTAKVIVTGKGNYNNTNYAEFKIVPKSINTDDVVIEAIPDQEYTGFALTPKITVTDDTGVLKEGTDFEVAYAANINVADKPVVTVTGIGNYGESRITTFTIVPKPIKAAWAQAIPNQTYTGYAINPTLTITDADRAAVLVLDTDYTVTYASNINVADKPVVTVTGIGNYKDQFELTFVIDPKDIGDSSIVIAPIPDQVYTTAAITPSLTVTDSDRADQTLTPGTDYTTSYSNNVNVSSTTAEKAATATITGTGNYKGTNSINFIIIRKPVKPIKITVNGPSEAPTHLGGPNADKYHTITIDAEPGEKMTVGIAQDSNILAATLGVTAGNLTIANDSIIGAVLDGSGHVTYQIIALYEDRANLTTDATTSASASEADGDLKRFVYDTVAEKINVHPLYNRAAKGVEVTLSEGYRLVEFKSSGAGDDFVATNGKSLPAGDHLIPFRKENPKLNSSAKGGSFTGIYEDYVGNPGKVGKQDILKAKGTIEISSVEPSINGAGRIGNTPTLTFTVRMSADGGHSELAGGGVFGSVTLTQGEQQIVVSSSGLAADTTNTPSLSFDDLEGSTSFRSFIYDPVCDAPVLTMQSYAGCYYLMGIAEPYSYLVMEVNGERVTGSADAFGVFALKMPLVEEGDIIALRVTDQAGNIITMTYKVGSEAETVPMDAYMAGRVFTNAHNAKPGEPLEWTMILTASVADLKAGNVSIPIYAGNMISVGKMSVKMDENNTLSYSYTLDDGVEVQGEKFIANTKLDKDAFIAQSGIEISQSGTVIPGIRKGEIYLSCKLNVKVPADRLKTTFQTEKIKDSDMKRLYRDIQIGKLE